MLARALAQAGPLQGDAPELEEPEAHPVSAAVPFQPAHGAQLVRQPVNGRLGQAHPVADLADAQSMITAVERGKDGLKSAYHRACLAVLLFFRVRFPERKDVAAPGSGRANAVLKRSYHWVTSSFTDWSVYNKNS